MTEHDPDALIEDHLASDPAICTRCNAAAHSSAWWRR